MWDKDSQWMDTDGYLIDANSVFTLEHNCNPYLCRDSGSCCADHDIWVDGEERKRILVWGRRAVEAFPFLGRELCEGNGPFRRLGPDLYVMDTCQEGICVWAYRGEKGEVSCALHSIALEHDVPPEIAKPRGCSLWPLCISGGAPPIVSVQPGAENYPCNTIIPEREKLHLGTGKLLKVLKV